MTTPSIEDAGYAAQVAELRRRHAERLRLPAVELGQRDA